METTAGLIRVKSVWLLAPILLLAACGDKNTTSGPTNANPPPSQQSDAIHQWRQQRAARGTSETPVEPKPSAAIPTNTNSAAILKSLSSFSDRLGAIVGDPIDNDDAVRKKAEAGDANAQTELGATLWREGKFEEALKWYEKAAAQGQVKAQHSLGVMYVFGQGVEQNYETAIQWFTKAAEQGDIESQYSLGVRYAKGDHGEQDFAQAVKWFTMAANQGSADAQVSLGRRYAGGEGVEKNLVEAYKWFTVAVGNGHWAGTSVRDGIIKNMTPEEISRGEELASQFKPSRK